jgi:5-methylcytosine-specific restriction endonuclease McrA
MVNVKKNLYGTAAWQKLRRGYLMANPLCVFCARDGRTTAASVVDHITPHRGNEQLFFAGPFQALCKQHHDSTKQRQEKSGVISGGDETGAPIDPNHHWNK